MAAMWNVWVSNDKHLRLSVYVNSADARSTKRAAVNAAVRKAKAKALPKLQQTDPSLKLKDITGARCVG